MPGRRGTGNVHAKPTQAPRASDRRQRVRQRNLRLNPCEAMLCERQCAKERRGDSERKDGCAGVMQVPRKRQLLGACAAAKGACRFEHGDMYAGAGKRNSCAQAVRAAADNGRVLHAGMRCYAPLRTLD